MMAVETYALDPEAGLFDRHRKFSDRAVWTYVFAGLAVLITIFASSMWADSGFLEKPWSGGRIFAALTAILYGLGLGWILFPRRPNI